MALCCRKHYYNLLCNIGSNADHVDDDVGGTVGLGFDSGDGGGSSSISSSSSGGGKGFELLWWWW